MIMDKENQFSDAQAITATAVSTNYVDLGIARNIGVGENMYLVMIVTTAFTDSGSDSTVTPSLETDDNTSFSSPVTLRTYDVIAALAAANTKRVYRIEPYNDAGRFERYIQLRYTLANGSLTTGAITAFLSKDAQLWAPYASGFSIN